MYKKQVKLREMDQKSVDIKIIFSDISYIYPGAPFYIQYFSMFQIWSVEQYLYLGLQTKHSTNCQNPTQSCITQIGL